MARMIPPVLPASCQSKAEAKIFSWFRDAPGTDDWIVLYSVVETKHPKVLVGETDFVVLAPGYGCFALEVKGGRVARDEEGMWVFTDGDGHITKKSRGPYEQASEGKYAIADYLEKENPPESANPELGKVYFHYGVMFPDICFENTDFGIGEAQEIVFDARYGKNVVSYIKNLSAFWNAKIGEMYHFNPKRIINRRQADLIAKQLRKSFDRIPSLSHRVQEAEEELIALTEEEYAAIDATEDNRHMVYLGPAGTGKTLIALEQARRSQEAKIALFCYNRNLAEWLKKKAAAFENRGNICFVGTFHSLMMENIKKAGISIPSSKFDNPTFYDEDIADLFVESLITCPLEFDFVIVDEFQDLLTDSNLVCLDAICKGGFKRGHFAFYADFKNQTIYQDYKNESEALEHLQEYATFAIFRLKKNCRNTAEICEQIHDISGLTYKSRLNGPSGIKVDFKHRWTTLENEAAQVRSIIRDLHENNGISYSDIIVLSPKTRMNSCVSLIPEVKDYSPDLKHCVRFETIYSFKGLESKVVILCDIESYEASYQEKCLIYTGISRARTYLFVLETNAAMKERIRIAHRYDEEQ